VVTTDLIQGLQRRSPAVTTPGPDGDFGASAGTDVLAAWVQRTGHRAGERPRGRVRFAFYGRVSTEDGQDPVMSCARQQDQARVPVTRHGTIVAEFFDSGHSRALPWARRPRAAALVAALADPDRGWDAIVTGEYERAFYGNQYASMAPLFEHYGVSLAGLSWPTLVLRPTLTGRDQ
jgi:site-specific DNA recombinase